MDSLHFTPITPDYYQTICRSYCKIEVMATFFQRARFTFQLLPDRG